MYLIGCQTTQFTHLHRGYTHKLCLSHTLLAWLSDGGRIPVEPVKLSREKQTLQDYNVHTQLVQTYHVFNMTTLKLTQSIWSQQEQQDSALCVMYVCVCVSTYQRLWHFNFLCWSTGLKHTASFCLIWLTAAGELKPHQSKAKTKKWFKITHIVFASRMCKTSHLDRQMSPAL